MSLSPTRDRPSDRRLPGRRFVPRARRMADGMGEAVRLHQGWALVRRSEPGTSAAILLAGETLVLANGVSPLALTDTLWTRLPQRAEAALAVWPMPGPEFAAGSAPLTARLAEARVAAVLLDLQRRLHRRDATDPWGPFAVPGLCDTLAAAAGLDPQPARRALDALHRCGFLRCYGEVVALCDRRRMAALASDALGVRA